MAALIKAGESTFKLILIIAGLLGALMILGGIALVYLGATGDTEISLFGQSFKSQSVGVVGIFCGAVVEVLAFQQVLKAINKIVDKPGGPKRA